LRQGVSYRTSTAPGTSRTELTQPGATAYLAAMRLGLVACAALLASGPGCARHTPIDSTDAARSAPDSERVTLSFLGLNDLHGQLRALPWFAGAAHNLQKQLGARGAVVLVDAGDMFQGTLESNLSEGASVVAAYDALGIAAAAVGNHEFDFGRVGLDARHEPSGGDPQGALKARIAEARFSFVCANLIDELTRAPVSWPGLSASVWREISGVRVGFVGVLTEETPHIVMPANFHGIAVAPAAPSVEASARRLREAGADVVVLLAHAGAVCSEFDNPHDRSSCDRGEIFAIVERLSPGLVDVVVAGHTHAGVAHYVAGVPIVEAYHSGRAFSRVDVIIDRTTHRVLEARPFPPEPLCASADSCLRDYAGATVQPDARLVSSVAPALELAEKRRQVPLGVVAAARVEAVRDVESSLGNLFADLMRSAVPGADVALTNGGGLRADLPAGELTYGDLYEAMPFDNRLVTLELSGADLRRVITEHLRRAEHGIVSISGLRVIARCAKAELVVELWRESGQRVSDDTRLTVVTSDYLALGGDRLLEPLGLERGRKQVDRGMGVRDALTSQLSARGGELDPRKLFDPRRPRIGLPSARPVRCSQ
jgi:5'-nucleotidase